MLMLREKNLTKKNRSDSKNAIRKHYEIFNQSKDYLKDNNFIQFKNKKNFFKNPGNTNGAKGMYFNQQNGE